ncbi:AMP-binding protein [Streptomyces thermocarboxydus]
MHRTLSWQGLDARARAVAGRLHGTVRPGDRVALLLPQGLDYTAAFLGCLYAGVIAVPLFTPDLAGHGAGWPPCSTTANRPMCSPTGRRGAGGADDRRAPARDDRGRAAAGPAATELPAPPPTTSPTCSTPRAPPAARPE